MELYSQIYEEAIIGAICVYPEAINDVLPILAPEDFAIDGCKRVYEAMQDAVANGNAFDTVIAVNAVRTSMNDAEGFVRRCMESCLTSANTRVYAQRIHQLARNRRLRDAIAAEMESGSDDFASTIAGLCQDHLRQTSGAGHSIASMMQEYYASLSKPIEKRINTGFTELDKLLKGMEPGNLVYVGARPGVGKSAFLSHIALTAAASGVKTVIFSMEMTSQEIAERFVSKTARVPMGVLIDRNLPTEKDDGTWFRIRKAVEMLTKYPIDVYDLANMSVEGIRAKVRGSAENIGLIIVDYIGLMQGKKADTRNLELGGISRGLKNLATELHIPIIAATQLNRATNETSRPTMKDIRDSGELEQDANKIIFLWKQDPEEKVIGCSVAKNRRGATGQVFMQFEGEYMTFTEMPDYEPKTSESGGFL